MKYISIYKSSLVDGLGWRVVLFVSGCSHKCPGCHNPQSWNADYGHDFDDNAKQIIFDALDKKEISGLTLSGGDPLFKPNIKAVTELCKEVKEKYPTKDIWLYTGYLYEDVKDLEIMKYVKIVVDGPFKQELKSRNTAFKGSDNQNIIHVATGKVLNL